MEHVVQLCAGRQLKTVGHLVDDGGDAVRPVVTGTELALGDALQSGWRAMAKAELDPFAHRVVDLPVMLVVDLPVDVLGLF
jgi:hypothetical protein